MHVALAVAVSDNSLAVFAPINEVREAKEQE